jgi:hypothetical protein
MIMADPHNKKRYGETWNPFVLNNYLRELLPLKDLIILSGGWAWHFMSPPGHEELKHAHDHKDVDIFVLPKNVSIVAGKLAKQGFKKVPTRFDHLKNNSDFRRYEKEQIKSEVMRAYYPELYSDKKLIIDFFVQKDIRVRVLNDGWQVVDPEQLLSFYGNIHSSDNCFAVKAATALLKKGVDPVGKQELMKPPK